MSELKAGAELDAMVAEKVMGWTWHIVRIHASTNTMTAWVRPGHHVPKTIDPGNNWNAPLPYSTDIAAAWEVVEKMYKDHKLGMWMDVTVPESGIDAYFGDFKGAADTAPLAICLAALKAVGAIK